MQEDRETRALFRNVFKGEEGASVLTWILGQCGYYTFDPAEADQVLLAFANRLLNKIGIVHMENLVEDTISRLNGANDKDIATMEASNEQMEA
jgi:hypothetical protein